MKLWMISRRIDVLTAAEIAGVQIRNARNTYAASSFGFKATCTAGRVQAARARAQKAADAVATSSLVKS